MTTTPILPGFYPDPSICRVGERYYLVTSTFEYFPGVPIFTSTDLVTWEQIGNVLARPSQLRTTAGRAGSSSGIYAPTLRHHDGRFWLATTDFGTVSQGHLIVHAEDPSGPWSVPVHTTGAIGIDPDLSWDDAGVCYLTWSDVTRGGISQVPVDPRTGAVLGDSKEIWRGTGGAHAEGPHLVRRGQWWYLLAAEGGTSIGHMVTVARSRSINGPFEPAPTNPILTHRSTSSPVQSTGHADVVERADGSWALVHLGTRIRGSFPRWHTNGRESFLAGLEWVDDWPVVREEAFTVPEVARRFEDDFTAPALDARWIAPGAVPAEFALPGKNGLVLKAGRPPQESGAQRLLAVRATDLSWTARAEAEGDLALVVRIDDAHQVMVERIGQLIRARAVIGPLDQVLAERTPVAAATSLVVTAAPAAGQRGERTGPDRLLLGYIDGQEFVELTQIDGHYLSTEVAGGFTGRVIGLEALGGDARVTRFVYEGSVPVPLPSI